MPNTITKAKEAAIRRGERQRIAEKLALDAVCHKYESYEASRHCNGFAEGCYHCWLQYLTEGNL